MARGAWIRVLLLLSASALVSTTAAHAASPPAMRVLLTHQGVWEGGRYLMYLEPTTGSSGVEGVPVLFDARTLTVVRRLTLPPGCKAIYFRFGKALLRCGSWPAVSWGLMSAWSDEVRMFPVATEAGGFRDGYTTLDSFTSFNRYWAVGSREGSFFPSAAYLDLSTGRVTVIEEDRYDDEDENTFIDDEDPNLGRYKYGPCSRARPGHYEVAFAHFMYSPTSGARDVFLYNCRRHTRTRLAHCPRACVGTHQNARPADGLALWLAPADRRLYARRVKGDRTCTWKLPRAMSELHAFGAGGHVFVTTTRPGASTPELRVARPRRC